MILENEQTGKPELNEVLPELPRDVWLKIIQMNMRYHSEWNEWIRHFQECQVPRRLVKGSDKL